MRLKQRGVPNPKGLPMMSRFRKVCRLLSIYQSRVRRPQHPASQGSTISFEPLRGQIHVKPTYSRAHVIRKRYAVSEDLSPLMTANVISVRFRQIDSFVLIDGFSIADLLTLVESP